MQFKTRSSRCRRHTNHKCCELQSGSAHLTLGGELPVLTKLAFLLPPAAGPLSPPAVPGATLPSAPPPAPAAL